jgi:hypothetical protein
VDVVQAQDERPGRREADQQILQRPVGPVPVALGRLATEHRQRGQRHAEGGGIIQPEAQQRRSPASAR